MLQVRNYTDKELERMARVDPSKALGWEFEEYAVVKIKSKMRTKEGMRTVKTEYTRLRDIAQKRIKRLSSSAEFSDTQFYKNYQSGFKKLSETSAADLPFEMNRLFRFTASRQSTVQSLAEIRDRTIATLHYNNYTFVNKENYNNFGGFMQTVKELYNVKKIPDSDLVAELFYELSRGGIDWRDLFEEMDMDGKVTAEDAFKWWVDHRNTIQKRSAAMDRYDEKRREQGKKPPAGTKVQRMMKRYKTEMKK